MCTTGPLSEPLGVAGDNNWVAVCESGGVAEGTSTSGWDFFVSYTQADREWAEWIAWILEEAGHRVVVQAWDMVPGSNWVQQMNRALREAARLVAVISPDYEKSVYGTAEWHQFWAADPLGEQRKVIPVRVGGAWPKDLLRSVVGIDLVGVPEPEAQQRLLAGIEAARVGRAKPVRAPTFPAGGRVVAAYPGFPGRAQPVFNVPPRNPNFTGRDFELQQLRVAVSVGAAVTVQAVHGMAGVGKTQTVIEYAHRHASEYELVWWVNAEQPSLITDQLSALAAPLGLPTGLPPEEAVRAVCTALRGRDGWLLISTMPWIRRMCGRCCRVDGGM